MAIARSIAALSKDDTQVGAIILGPTNEIRSVGYNGAPRGCSADEDERMEGRPEKYFWVAHAEANAVYNAARVGTPLEGCTMMVTHFPCMECSKAIVQVGIKKVVVSQMDEVFAKRWAEHIVRSKALFVECGVDVEMLESII
jgi:dCMP deaminase